jgi:hypothetical protein
MGESFKKGASSEGSAAEGKNMFARFMRSLDLMHGDDRPTTARQARRNALRRGHGGGRAPHEQGKPPYKVKAKRRARSRNAKAARRRNRG